MVGRDEDEEMSSDGEDVSGKGLVLAKGVLPSVYMDLGLRGKKAETRMLLGLSASLYSPALAVLLPFGMAAAFIAWGWQALPATNARVTHANA